MVQNLPINYSLIFFDKLNIFFHQQLLKNVKGRN
jgi:hypothetical protein